MSPKRLLLVTDEMEVGGSQRQISNLLGGLDRSRWRPELLFFRSPSFLVGEIESLGITVHHLPKRGRIDPFFVLRYAALLRRGGFDVVHAFSLTAELWTAVASMLVRNPPPMIASVRGLYLKESPLFWRLKRFVARRSAAVIANARACAAVASEHAGIAPEKFDVVANGVSIPPPVPPHFHEVLRAGLGCPPGRQLCLFVGRLVAEKNLPCLVRAMARLTPGQRPWIALAGDGPLRAEMQAMVDSEQLGADMRFLGERADATVLMQAADFLVLPSMQEGMSNAVLEAMSSGCAVIASAVGGNRELVEHGVSGLLFPNDDEQALSECLRLLCCDEDLRTRLAGHARERVRSAFGIDDMVAATAAVYERCLPAPAAPNTRARWLLRRQRTAGGGL